MTVASTIATCGIIQLPGRALPLAPVHGLASPFFPLPWHGAGRRRLAENRRPRALARFRAPESDQARPSVRYQGASPPPGRACGSGLAGALSSICSSCPGYYLHIRNVRAIAAAHAVHPHESAIHDPCMEHPLTSEPPPELQNAQPPGTVRGEARNQANSRPAPSRDWAERARTPRKPAFLTRSSMR